MWMGWALLVGSAQATWTTNINYVRAPNVPAPAGTQRVLLLDTAAGKLAPADQAVLGVAIENFRQKAQSSQTFEVVFVPTLNNPDLSVDPSWDELVRIAQTHDAQAILSISDLEFTMGRVEFSKVPVTVTRDGVEVQEQRHQAKQKVTALVGMRYWDPFSKTDLYIHDAPFSVSVSTVSKVRPQARTDLKPKAARQKSALAINGARWFADQVLAKKINVRRSFFANGKLKAGRNYAAVGKWVDARKTWRSNWDNGKKSGMKARYNVALTHEVTGNPRKALEVLDPLIGQWNKALVVNYYRNLKVRVANEDRLEQQGIK